MRKVGKTDHEWTTRQHDRTADRRTRADRHSHLSLAFSLIELIGECTFLNENGDVGAMLDNPTVCIL